MILREMPRVQDPTYAREFYRWWGTRNCVILAQTTRAEYGSFKQSLSIKMSSGGREDYFVDNRRLAVEDDNYLVLNEGRTYGSAIASRAPVESFTIFFRPGLLQEVHNAIRATPNSWLAREPTDRCNVELSEHLRTPDEHVLPALKRIRLGVLQGPTGPEWLEYQFSIVAERLLRAHARDLAGAERLSAVRASTRHEILRRLNLGVDFLHSNYTCNLQIGEAAAAAAMSRFHFSRYFAQAFHCTPQEFLRRKRVAAAQRLLLTTSLPVDLVAARVGLATRSTLFRAMREVAGVSPYEWRYRVTS
jgi:AraC family transcriptional regulator